MTTQTLTLVSGIVLLLLVALVWWNLRRRQARYEDHVKRSEDEA